MNDLNHQELASMIASGTDSPFRPFAYYDKHLDCIRVQLFDCSFTEKRLNRYLTVLHANHRDGQPHAGFNIKGVRALFEKVGLSMTGVIALTDVLSAMAKFYPDSALEFIKRQFSPVLGEEKLNVSLA